MRHVLPGGILRRRCRHQAPLAVDHVRHQPALADGLQAPDQVFEVHHRPDHPKETPAIHDGRADQHHRLGRFSAAHHQRLPAIDAPLARGLISAFQFTLQKFIGINSSRRNSLGVGIQQGRIGNVVRGRNKILQQRPQFRRLNILAANVVPALHLH